MNNVVTINALGAKTVRPDDDELHRAARQQLYEANHTVFEALPSLIGQIIEHKVWKSRGARFESFAEYALSQTSDGLNISNNQKLWMLRCALDVTGKHVREWAEVLVRVEEMVRLYIKTTPGSALKDFKHNSLEELGKNDPQAGNKVTYLPSYSHSQALDSQLLRLHRKTPDVYRRVIRHEMTMRDAIRQTGLRKSQGISSLERAIGYVKRMEKKDLHRFIEWLRSEGHV